MIAFLIHEGSQVRVISPYVPEFVADLKQIPYYAKSFDREQKCWLVEDGYSDLLENIAAEHFEVRWCVTEEESDQRVRAARAAAQRQTPQPSVSHTASQCLAVIRRVYAEEATLGLFPPADSEPIIRAVYRAQALLTHPDIAGSASTGAMVNLNRAYDVLLKRCKRVAS